MMHRAVLARRSIEETARMPMIDSACSTSVGTIGSAAEADVTLFSAVAVRAALTELIPQFEAQTGKKIALKFDLNPIVKKRIDEGEPFDVVLINPPMIDELIESGKVAAGSSVKFGRLPMGLAIRAGGQKPDITTVDAFKRVLRSSKSVGISGQGSSGIYFNKLITKLGIASEMKDKLRSYANGTEIGAALARGDVEYGASPVMNLHASGPGVEVIGAFPAELQSYIEFALARSAASSDAPTGTALIDFLTSNDTDAFLRGQGLERVI
jgi:molybdate transport system substrate-binding protein